MLPIKILRNDLFHAPRDDIVLRNCASVFAACLIKLFQLCLSTSTFPTSWKFAYIQPVPKKADCSNPSKYRPIALISCLSKVFKFILNKKILKHLSLHNRSVRQYGFFQGRSTDDLQAHLTESWSSSFRDFGETFAVALDISRAFDRVWHKALISKLPSHGFYPSLFNFISSFLSDLFVVAVIDGLPLNLLTVVFLKVLSYHSLSSY